MMYAAFIIDGLLWSFVGIFPYALLATFVDRKIVGTAFALCEGISFIVGSSARGLGAKMFTEMGATIPTYISFGIQLVGVIAIFFFDNERLKESAEEKRTEEKNTPSADTLPVKQDNPLKKLIAMFSVAALPFAILNGAQYIVYQIDSSFLPYYAEKMSFDYLTPATTGGIIVGIIGIVIGILCDVVKPGYFVIFAFTGQMLFPFILASAETSAMFGAAVMMFFLAD